MRSNLSQQVTTNLQTVTSADPEGGGGGAGVLTLPIKSQVIWVSKGISNWTPLPLEKNEPPPLGNVRPSQGP